ncbi:MAG: hypothetical protein QF535_02505, partial [Anaerolineales bacterium]|nr:hypothetical protein [Anaerolineales bacterium]
MKTVLADGTTTTATDTTTEKAADTTKTDTTTETKAADTTTAATETKKDETTTPATTTAAAATEEIKKEETAATTTVAEEAKPVTVLKEDKPKADPTKILDKLQDSSQTEIFHFYKGTASAAPDFSFEKSWDATNSTSYVWGCVAISENPDAAQAQYSTKEVTGTAITKD